MTFLWDFALWTQKTVPRARSDRTGGARSRWPSCLSSVAYDAAIRKVIRQRLARNRDAGLRRERWLIVDKTRRIDVLTRDILSLGACREFWTTVTTAPALCA